MSMGYLVYREDLADETEVQYAVDNNPEMYPMGTAIQTEDGVAWLVVFNDGVTVVLQALNGGGGGSDTFIGLTDTPTNYVNKGHAVLSVNDEENGVSFSNEADDPWQVSIHELGNLLVPHRLGIGIDFAEDAYEPARDIEIKTQFPSLLLSEINPTPIVPSTIAFALTDGGVKGEWGYDYELVGFKWNANTSLGRGGSGGTVFPEEIAMLQSGDLGLGISPAYKLDVDGDVNITGAYRVNGTPTVLQTALDAALDRLDLLEAAAALNGWTL